MQRPAKLMNRNFFLLWQGQSVSRLGIQAFEIAMLFWIKHATDSATLMGLMLMLSNLPGIVLGPIGGTFADRYSRRAIILVSETLNGIAVLSLAALLFVAPESTDIVLVWLFIVSFVSAVVSSFFNPAMSAAIPDLVPETRVATANSLSQFTAQIAVFFGQGIGGTLFRLLGAPILFLINGLTYLFSAACVLFIRIPQEIPAEAGDWRKQFTILKVDLMNGFRYVWHTHGLRELVFVSAFLNFFTVPIIVLLPFYVEDFLKVSVDWYGFLLAAYGVGSVIGYVLAGIIRLEGNARSRVMVSMIILESFGYGLLGFADSPYTALALALLGGCVGGFVGILITTLLQITTPGDIRGRVFGFLATIAGSITPIAMGMTGVIADALGHDIALIYISCGAILFVLSILVSLSREFRNYLAFEREHLVPEPLPNPAVSVH
ncbi:MAG: MFS transporter [Chloroflexi bacterium]|nr:MFS transporter [Chloroflexota bacterium]